MATYSIKAVRLERAPGASHDHIAYVKLTTDEVLARSTVISRIKAGNRFITNATPAANVYVHSCPFCGASDYITTHPDGTATNNLLHLPKF